MNLHRRTVGDKPSGSCRPCHPDLSHIPHVVVRRPVARHWGRLVEEHCLDHNLINQWQGKDQPTRHRLTDLKEECVP